MSNLTPDQQKAFENLVSFVHRDKLLFRLQGFAGTGKSYLICEFLKWIKSASIQYIAASPTNKAAKNLRKIAKDAGLDLDVKTVAQLLGQQPQLNEETGEEEFLSQGEDSIGQYKLVIVDEFSMVNKDNFEEIVNKSSLYRTKIIFVGDRAQLPPINEEEPKAATYPMDQAVLNSIVRYDGDIVRVAENLRKGVRFYRFETTQDGTVTVLPESDWLAKATDLFKSQEYKANSDHVRILAWRNKTVKSFNNYVREQLWGKDAPDYVIGDRLIARQPLFRPKPGGQGKSKWNIVINNSEEAIVTGTPQLETIKAFRQEYLVWKMTVQPNEGIAKEVMILHQDSVELHKKTLKKYVADKQWSSYFDLSRIFDNIGYAYALTTHKAQGSSIENVLLDFGDMEQAGDRQKLLYTALTRTTKQAFILDR